LISIENENAKMDLRDKIINLNIKIGMYEREISSIANIDLDFNNLQFIETEYKNGNCIFTFFLAERTLALNSPSGIQKISFRPKYSSQEKANQIFIQYLVNLKAQRSFARDDGNMKIVSEIDNWFVTFENYLKEIFEDETLQLEFDSANFNFNIIQKNKEKFDFFTLSDGYSSILNIVTELIARMEKRSSKTYEIQGIVLIDEIETHLHIDLQKKILPFLTKVFPNIQFIVSTHSPFVINSCENAVIYDLENDILVENMSGYSYDSIVESYYNSDKYSQIVKQQIAEYETLCNKEFLSEEDEERLVELKLYFKELPKFLAPELSVKLQQIEFSKIGKK